MHAWLLFVVGVQAKRMEKLGIEMSCLRRGDGSGQLCVRREGRRRKKKFGERRKQRGRKGRRRIREPRDT
jgi:hypothetical protein